MKEIEQITLEKLRKCDEKDGMFIHYCEEYDNYYCPRKCYYAKQRFKEVKRKFNVKK